MSKIVFDKNLGLAIPTTEEVRLSIQNEWKNAFGVDLNVSPQSPQGQLIDSQTAHIAVKNTEVLKLSQQFNPLTAEGIWQDALGYIYFLQRKVATPSYVECECKGLYGTRIPKNALVSDSQNRRFYLQEDIIIGENSTASGIFICEEQGAIEVKIGEISQIISVIHGWDSVYNKVDAVIGNEEESQIEFEKRRYLSVSKNAHGTAASVYGALANLDNVIDVIVIENNTSKEKEELGVKINPHSLYISVVGGENDELAKTIYTKISAGCDTTGTTKIKHIDTEFSNAEYVYNITRPDPLGILIKVVIRLTPSTPSTIEDNIKESLYNNFYGLDNREDFRISMGKTLYSSRFYTSVIDAGAQDLLSIKIASEENSQWIDEIFIPADKHPVFSYENVAIEIEE